MTFIHISNRLAIITNYAVLLLHISYLLLFLQQHSMSLPLQRQTNECSSKPEFASGAGYVAIWRLYIQFITKQMVFYS